MLSQEFAALIRDVPDFPKPGIIFKDITPLLQSPAARTQVIELIKRHFESENMEAVAGIEARGFLFGVPLADALGVPFIPVRKQGKLPYDRVSESYALEYGQATIEIHRDAVQKGQRVLIHDDLLATGGTCMATASLLKKLGAVPAGFSFLINLSFLDGAEKIVNGFQQKPHWLVNF
jgi:adenine phosphoribosyltransferase